MSSDAQSSVPRRRTVVVGGGMLGLGLARRLAADRDVIVLEAAPNLGGLASAWTLDTPAGPVRWDRFYHVVLSADKRVLSLYDELGLGDLVHWSTVRSELLSRQGVLPMSTVLDLLKLRPLRPVDRVRVGLTVGIGALLPIGRRADSITAAKWVRRWSGRKASVDLWDPLLRAKLGLQAEEASSVFLRATFRRLLLARLRGGVGDRFGWVEGGYGRVLEELADDLTRAGVDLRCASPVRGIAPRGSGWVVQTAGGEIVADEVVITTAGPIAATLLQNADPIVRERLAAARYLGCVCVSVVLRQRVTGAYLTYVTEDTPYTAIIEMSNHVDPAQFAGHHLVYLPKYTAPDDPLMTEDPDVVAERFVADLLSRYPHLAPTDILAARTARARYVMPVPTPGWASNLPPARTGLPGLWLASSAQVADGTLNIETTLQIADHAADLILGEVAPPASSGLTIGADHEVRRAASNTKSTNGVPMTVPDSTRLASVSLDADNLWSYLKTRGDASWQSYPSYLAVLGPRLRELWAERNITATVFVVGRDATTDDGAQFVQDLTRDGHEIANHSFDHEPWLHTYSRSQLEDELARTEEALIAAGAPRPVGFRGPGYSLSPDLLRLLGDRGYLYDCTTLPTWIGPLARAYYFRASGLDKEERQRRNLLFGSAREGLRRNRTYRWTDVPGGDLLEIPVTTMPGFKVPIHISYLVTLHQVNPRAMRTYFRSALRLCLLSGTAPSMLMHPLDLLDGSDAPGLEFFPGMSVAAATKRDVANWALTEMQKHFAVVGTGSHARSLTDAALPLSAASSAGPRK